jgi:hypothetical protein
MIRSKKALQAKALGAVNRSNRNLQQYSAESAGYTARRQKHYR